MFERKQKLNETETNLNKKDQYIAEKVTAKNESESERLTKLEQERLVQERAANLTAAIHKISEKRKLQGDKQVFNNDEEFKEAGLEILKKFNASDSEKNWFTEVVEKSPFPK